MKIVKKFLVAFLILIALFILLELLAKIANHAVFKNKIDPQGLRTEFEEIYVPPFAPKGPDEFRIFVYGGSTVAGLPLPKVGFVSQLQYQLNRVFEGKNIKVFNFGWAGFNSTRIRYILERTVSQKPDLIIVYTGENEFIYPQLDFYFLVRTVTALKNRSDLAKLMLFAVKQTNSDQVDNLQSLDKKFPAYGVNKMLVYLKYIIFRNNLEAIIEQTSKQQVPVILGIPAHNVADWPPVRREITTLNTPLDYQQGLQQISELIDGNQLEEANNLIDALLSKYQDDASLLFFKGQIAAKNGQNAQDLFEAAKDADLIPWRTTANYANYLKSLEDKKNVWVVDFPHIFAQNSPNNVVGFNLILDGTHPTKEGDYLISVNIIDFLKKEKLIDKQWIEESHDLYSMEELFKVMNISSGDDFFIYLKTAQLALKSPLLNTKAAKMYIEKAEGINNNNWETKAVRASTSFLDGDLKNARDYLNEAEGLKNGSITRQESEHIPYLWNLLTN